MAFLHEPKIFGGDGVYIGTDQKIQMLRAVICIPLLVPKENLEYIKGYLEKFYPHSEVFTKYTTSVI